MFCEDAPDCHETHSPRLSQLLQPHSIPSAPGIAAPPGESHDLRSIGLQPHQKKTLQTVQQAKVKSRVRLQLAHTSFKYASQQKRRSRQSLRREIKQSPKKELNFNPYLGTTSAIFKSTAAVKRNRCRHCGSPILAECQRCQIAQSKYFLINPVPQKQLKSPRGNQVRANRRQHEPRELIMYSSNSRERRQQNINTAPKRFNYQWQNGEAIGGKRY